MTWFRANRFALQAACTLWAAFACWACLLEPPGPCDVNVDQCYFRCAGLWCRRGEEYCAFDSAVSNGQHSCRPMPADCDASESACGCLRRTNECERNRCTEPEPGAPECCVSGCCGPC